MKKLALLTSLVLAGGLVIAQESSKPAPAAAKSHDVTVEFVSADSEKKTITIKTEDGQQKTLPVEGKADITVYQITKVTRGRIKAGDKITVTCRDDKGEHKAITAIVVGPAPAKTK